MNFSDAMHSDDMLTTNGMPTHSTTGSNVLDFFAKSGALRKNPQEGLDLFKRAYNEDSFLSTKAMFYSRDIRGGQGERELFRRNLAWLAQKQPGIVERNILNIPKFGRWDDLEALADTPVQALAVKVWTDAILAGDGLAAKWAPRSGKWFAWMRNALGLKAGAYRRLIAGNSSTVEQQMCKREFGSINYSHVPSVASMKYRKAFTRQDKDRYQQFLAQVEQGEVMIHAGTLYPSDIVAKLWNGDDRTLEAQWKALPDYLAGSNQKILCMCDVSGSMMGTPMDVSVALGLYTSERLTGPFKDVIMTFSGQPTFHVIKGQTLRDRMHNVKRAHWGMNTDLEQAFGFMLGQAQKNRVAPSDMPTTLLIISDMQFDACVNGAQKNAMVMMRKAYQDAGYEFPKVVFWNVSASKGQPAKHTDTGIALVSGYSPSIMQSILSMQPMATPMDLMLETLMSDRYESVVR